MEVRTRFFEETCSEGSTVRMFDDGERVPEIIPELWMFGAYTTRLGRSA